METRPESKGPVCTISPAIHRGSHKKECSPCSWDKQVPLCLYQESVTGILTQVPTYILFLRRKTITHQLQNLQCFCGCLSRAQGVGADGRNCALRFPSSCCWLASWESKIWCSSGFSSILGSVGALKDVAMLIVLLVIIEGLGRRESST